MEMPTEAPVRSYVKKPDFICLGPRKTATTWLADHLKLHTDIWLTPIQELSYLHDGFSRYRLNFDDLRIKYDWWNILKQVVRNKGMNWKPDARFYQTVKYLCNKNEIDLVEYEKLFAPAGSKISADISPVYASLEDTAAKEFRACYGDTRILLFVRDPVARFWSEYSMYLRRGKLNSSLEPDLSSVISFFNDIEHNRQSFYSSIVDRWAISGGDKRTKIVLFDNIKENPEKELRSIVSFIGADWSKRIKVIKPGINRKKGDRRYEMSNEIQGWIVEKFKAELNYCAESFGDIGKSWRLKYLYS